MKNLNFQLVDKVTFLIFITVMMSNRANQLKQTQQQARSKHRRKIYQIQAETNQLVTIIFIHHTLVVCTVRI